jgi:hypothetical protein
MVTIGDCIIDSAGIVGLVVDASNTDVVYKAYSCDGIEFVYHSSPKMVLQMSDRFKKMLMREIRMIQRRNHEEDGLDA